MTDICSSSDLRYKYSDLTAISNSEYKRLCGKSELYLLLEEGLSDVQAGKGCKAADVFSNIQEKFGFDEI